MKLPVNEMFQSIQGEAHWTGAPSVFIRLQGCDVGCPWCDTKHTWKIDAARAITFDIMLDKPHDTEGFALLDADEMMAIVAERFPAPRHVVITGGEPCQYDMRDLTAVLRSDGRSVQIETSGTQPILACWDTWVTLSPKIAMPGGFEVRSDAIKRAQEIKMPVGREADIQKLLDMLKANPHANANPEQIWLQPLSTSEKATELCIQAATLHGWRVSLQTHKFIGVR